MNIQHVDTTRVIPYARNAKLHPKDQIEKIAQQISEVGFLVPIIVDKEMVVIAGHGRLEAAKALNLKEVPVIVADHLSDDQTMAFRIADNKVAESGLDRQLLAFEMGTLERHGFNLELTGFTLKEVQALRFEFPFTEKPPGEGGESGKGEEEVPEPPRIVRTQRGDLWKLGDHTLMCGDATDPTEVDFLLCQNKPTFIFTDPPYGISAVSKDGKVGGDSKGVPAKTYIPVKGDENTDVARAAFEILKKYSAAKMIIWGGNYFTDFLPPSPCWLIWDKQRGEGLTFADGEVAWTNLTTPLKFIRHRWDGYNRASERDEERSHPTQKPSYLAEWAFKEYGNGTEVVLDLFGGSGSTLIAAEKMRHKAFLMELEAGYCDVMLERWARLTNREPTRQDGKTWSEVKAEPLPASPVE